MKDCFWNYSWPTSHKRQYKKTVKNKQFEILCVIWYHLYNLKNLRNTHGGVLLLVKLQTEACNFNKSNTPLWVFLTFFRLYKWYQIPQSIPYKWKLVWSITCRGQVEWAQVKWAQIAFFCLFVDKPSWAINDSKQKAISQSSDISNFIGNDQKFAKYHLVVY